MQSRRVGSASIYLLCGALTHLEKLAYSYASISSCASSSFFLLITSLVGIIPARSQFDKVLKLKMRSARPAPLQLPSASQGVSASGILVPMSVPSDSPMSASSRHSFIEMDFDEYTTDGTSTYSPVPPPSSSASSNKKQRRRRGFPPPRQLSPVREASDDDVDAATLSHPDTASVNDPTTPDSDPATSSDRDTSTTDVNGEIVLLPTLGGDATNYYRRPSLTDDLGETDEIQAEMVYSQKRYSPSLVYEQNDNNTTHSRRSSAVSISTLSEFPIPPPSASAFIIRDSSPMSSSESEDDDVGGGAFEPPYDEELDLDAIVIGEAKDDREQSIAGIPIFPGSGSHHSMIPDSPSFLSNAFLQPRRAPLPPPSSSSSSSTSASNSPASSAAASPPSSSSSFSSPLSASPTLPTTPHELDLYDEPLVSPHLRSRHHGDWRRAIDDMYALSNAKVIDALSQSTPPPNSRPSSPTSSVYTFGKQPQLPKLKNSRSVPSLKSAAASSPRSSEDSSKTSTSSCSVSTPKAVFPDEKYTGTHYTYYSRERTSPHSTRSSSSSSSSTFSSTPRAGTPTPNQRGSGTGTAVSGIEEPAAKAFAILGLGVHSTPSNAAIAGKKWHLGFGTTAKRSGSPIPVPPTPRAIPTSRSLGSIPRPNPNKKSITTTTLPLPIMVPPTSGRRARGPSSASMTTMASSHSTQSSSSGSSGVTGSSSSSSRRSGRSNGSTRVTMPNRRSIPLELLIRA